MEIGNASASNPFLNDALLINSAAINNNAKENLKNAKTNEKNKAGKTSAFSKILNKKLENERDIEGLSKETTLETLLDNIHSAGDDLIKHPYPEQIMQYRDSIKKFMNYVVDNVYTVEKEKGIMNLQNPQYKNVKDPDVRRKLNVYASIKVIDQKLDNLASSILMSQAPQIKLLASIEEINGLIVDMLR